MSDLSALGGIFLNIVADNTADLEKKAEVVVEDTGIPSTSNFGDFIAAAIVNSVVNKL